MENFSLLTFPLRQPWMIEIHPYLYDHTIEDRAVYPAAEAISLLCRAVKTNFPRLACTHITDAVFRRFLVIPPDEKTLAVSVEITAGDKNEINASLCLSLRAKTGNIKRTVEYARLKLAGSAVEQVPMPDWGGPEKPEGEIIKVTAQEIYQDLVPFGKAYQNIVGDLTIAPAGAQAVIAGGNSKTAEELLGSPFPFDAVLQMACIWAQRFTGTVVFPVGFAERIIHQKTRKRMEYQGCIAPVAVTTLPFIFDASIFDRRGNLCETVTGIQMADVSRGRLKPPAWIKATIECPI